MELFDREPYCREFTGKVLSCTQVDRETSGKKGGSPPEYQVVLDQTAFYPEGGGQPWDTGELGGASVVAVRKKEGQIVHYCTQSLEIGAEVPGNINWPRRFDLMQQHSGEHMFSGIAHRLYGCDNVGFHLGEESVTIDLNRELSGEQVARILAETNQYITENHPIQVSYPTADQLKTLDYRSKKELSGEVRIVSFPGADTCACCGIHVALSGEVRLAHVIAQQKFRDGVRIEQLFGGRALEYFAKMEQQNREISRLLSAKMGETATAVGRLLSERDSLKERVKDLEQQQIQGLVSAFSGKSSAILVVEGLSGDGLRQLAVALSEEVTGLSLCLVPDGEGGVRYALASQQQDVREMGKALNQEFSGRGGGKPNLVQGSLTGRAQDVEDFVKSII